MDIIEDCPLLWLEKKQSTLKKLVSLKHPDNLSELSANIPLSYVCFGPKNVLVPKKKYLTLNRTGIHFDCFTYSDVPSPSISYDVDFRDIIKLSCAKNNCLIYFNVSKIVYQQMFYNKSENNSFFSQTIWFCLDMPDKNEYEKSIKNMMNKFDVAMAISDLPQESFENFRKAMYQNKRNDDEFVHDWSEYLTTKQKNPTLPKFLSTVPNPKKSLKRKKEEFKYDISSSKRTKTDRKDAKYVYSPSPTHSIEITTADLLCLRPRTYLNDNIINLYTAFIYNEVISEEQRQKSHFFNCFFNTKLHGTPQQQLTDTAQTRHARVAKWTKNVDIFDMDYLVMPVIESDHWFLVIVCFPWMAGMVDYAEIFRNQGTSETPSSIPSNTSEFATTTRLDRVAKMRSELQSDPKPCILILDSLQFLKRSNKVVMIREYLKSEWDARRLDKDGPLIFDKTTVRGYCPKVPQQNNKTDCGVYLLHYMEMFFKNPIKDFSVEFFQEFLAKWFDQTIVDKKRAEIKEIIKRVAVRMKTSQDD